MIRVALDPSRVLPRFVGAMFGVISATVLVAACGEDDSGGCSRDTDCKGGRVCKAGDCVDPDAPVVAGCERDTDCDDGRVCDNGTCIASESELGECLVCARSRCAEENEAKLESSDYDAVLACSMACDGSAACEQVCCIDHPEAASISSDWLECTQSECSGECSPELAICANAPYEPSDCGVCELANCQTEYDAAMGNREYQTFITCVADCGSEEIGCLNACCDGSPGAAAFDVELAECKAQYCSSDCGNEDGIGICEQATIFTCNSCSAKNCETQIREYELHPETPALVGCYESCDDTECFAQCEVTHWLAGLARRPSIACIRANCESDCTDGLELRGAVDEVAAELCEGFWCTTSGGCLPESWMCDSEADCPDGSDEEGCACDGFTCGNGQCVPASSECDGANDCDDSSDEASCDCSTCVIGQCTGELETAITVDDFMELSDCRAQCNAELACEVQCATSHPDGYVADEPVGECMQARCSSMCEDALARRAAVDAQLGVCTPVCDGSTCGADGCGGTCGCGSNETCSASGVCECTGFACDDGQCVGRSTECDGTTDCRDGSDEEGCCTPDCSGRECGSDGCGGVCGTCGSNESCSTSGECVCNGYSCGNGECVSASAACDGTTDCRDSSDEADCCAPDCSGRECGDDGCGGDCGTCGSNETCSAVGVCICGGFPCDNGTCVPASRECDGNNDCSDGSDESHCLPDLISNDFSFGSHGPVAGEFTICLNRTLDGDSVDNGDYIRVTNEGDSEADLYSVRVGVQRVASGTNYTFPQYDLFTTGEHLPGTDLQWVDPICISENIMDLPEGDYRAIVYVDYYDDVAESDESNNVTQSSTTFTFYGTCSNSCIYAGDDECDDGGLDSDYSYCELGSDCDDCGVRVGLNRTPASGSAGSGAANGGAGGAPGEYSGGGSAGAW